MTDAPPTTRTPSRRLHAGHQVTLGFIFVAYVIPWVLDLAVADLQTPTHPAAWTLQAVGFVLLFAITYILLIKSRIRFVPSLRLFSLRARAAQWSAFYDRVRPVVAFFSFFVVIAFFIQGENSYRYEQQGISSNSGAPLIIATAVIQIWALLDVARTLFRTAEGTEFVRHKLGSLLFAGALLVSSNGIATAVLALVAVSTALIPNVMRRMAVVIERERPSERFAVGFLGMLLIVVGFLIAWVGGTSIKLSSAFAESGPAGVRSAAELVLIRTQSPDFAEDFFGWIGGRMSTYYYSFLIGMENAFPTVAQEFGWPAHAIFENMIFRLNYLLGSPFNLVRPEVGSVMRMNYLLITNDSPPSPRAGSAPGPLAAFIHVVPWPLAAVASAICIRWIGNVIEPIVQPTRGRLSLLGTLIAVGLFSGLLQSPMDWLLIIDGGFLSLISAFVVSKAVQQNAVRRSRQSGDGPEPIQTQSSRGHPVASEIERGADVHGK